MFQELAEEGARAWNEWARNELITGALRDSGQRIEIGAVPQGRPSSKKWRHDWVGFEFPRNVAIVGNWFEDSEDRSVSFLQAIFHGIFELEGSAGKGREFDFQKATFVGAATFRSFKEAPWPTFGGATFKDNAFFEEARLTSEGEVGFHSVTFEKDANFDRCTFSKAANFFNCTFHGDATFVGSTFESSAKFHHSKFWMHEDTPRRPPPPGWKPKDSANLRLKDADVLGDASFDFSTFVGAVDLRGTKFKRLVSFEECEFWEPPCLEAVVYEHPPSFAYSMWEPREWQSEAPRPKMRYGTAAIARYRRLKQLASERHDHRGELNLFVLETKARRANVLSWWRPKHWFELVTGSLYQIFSDFGRSIARPLLSLVILGFLWTGMFAWVGNESLRFWEWRYPVSIASLTSLMPFAGFAGVGRSVAEDVCAGLEAGRLSDCLSHLYFVSVVEGVLAAVFLFLLILGLRNTFRIR